MGYLSNKPPKLELVLARGLVSVRSQRLFLYRLVSRWLSFVQSREVSASWRFQMYYFYREYIAIGEHGICPLYRGCLPLGERFHCNTITRSGARFSRPTPCLQSQ